MIIAAENGSKLASLDIKGTAFGIARVLPVSSIFFEELFVLVIVDDHLASLRDRRSDLAIGDTCIFPGGCLDRDGRAIWLGFKSPVLGGHGSELGRSDTECVLTPWLDPEQMVVKSKDQFVVLGVQHFHSIIFHQPI
jgi:hypothetical protein